METSHFGVFPLSYRGTFRPELYKEEISMASNYTSNYGLCQWQASDKVLRTEFNADNAKIDAAIKAVDSRVTSVAGGKASASALESLKSTVASQDAALELRNCCFITGSYRGAGNFGINHPNTLTFPHKPVLVIVGSVNSPASDMIAIRGQGTVWFTSRNEPVREIVTWGDRDISWYNEGYNAAGAPWKQMNASETYFYFALMEVG